MLGSSLSICPIKLPYLEVTIAGLRNLRYRVLAHAEDAQYRISKGREESHEG